MTDPASPGAPRAAQGRQGSGWRVAALLLWSLAGCGPSHTGDVGAAAAGLVVAVAHSTLHRAATGSCWAHCPHGHVCDRQSGLCVALECAPGCPVGQHCVRELDGSTRCVANTGAITIDSSPESDAGVTSAPGATGIEVSTDVTLATVGSDAGTEDVASPEPPEPTVGGAQPETEAPE